MKLKLIYDFFSFPNGDQQDFEDCVEGDSGGFCSNFHTDSRLAHEKEGFQSSIYNRMYKYFSSRDKTKGITLVDIPDDIMLQYMMDGVFDYDYIAYDMHMNKICISNKKYAVTNYGDDRYGFGNSYSNYNTQEDVRIFDFVVDTTSEHDKQLNNRDEYVIVPDGEHHKNIVEALRPYVVYRFVEWFKQSAKIIYTTQNFVSGYKRNHPQPANDTSDTTNQSGRNITFLPDESGCTRVWDMRFDMFTMCLNFWLNDHEIFLEARKFISDHEVEAFRELCFRTNQQISETK